MYNVGKNDFMESRNLTLSIPVPLLEEAKKEARSIGLTLSEYIRQLIARSLGEESSSTNASDLINAFSELELKETKTPYSWKREDAYEDA